MFASTKCSLELAKASAATLPQQEENDSADVQQGRVHISGFVGKMVLELELELIQTQMAQKPMLRAEVYARALRASQNVSELRCSRPSLRCSFDEFKLLAIALLRALHH
jgi:hypothetical protein